MQTENKKVLPFREDLGGAKKHILKPGRHQFAPGSTAIHHNDNLSDEEAEWYLEKYPHIAALFVAVPVSSEPVCRVSDGEYFELTGEITATESAELQTISEQSQL